MAITPLASRSAGQAGTTARRFEENCTRPLFLLFAVWDGLLRLKRLADAVC